MELTALMRRMQSLLKAMHDANPSWGPLYVAFPGDLSMIHSLSPTGGEGAG